jgi:hypothetical protein
MPASAPRASSVGEDGLRQEESGVSDSAMFFEKEEGPSWSTLKTP